TFLGIGGGTGAGAATGAGGPQAPGTPNPGGNAPRVINLIQVQGSEQVLVRVRVVEMSRTLIRQLGINLNYSEMINQLVGSDNFCNAAVANGFSVNGVRGGLAASGGVVDNILRPNSLAYPSGVVDPSISTGQAGVGGYQVDADGTIHYGPAHVDQARRTDA